MSTSPKQSSSMGSRPASGHRAPGPAAMSTGFSKILTRCSVPQSLSAWTTKKPPRSAPLPTMTAGRTSLEVDLPYLWSNFGRHRQRRYYFYRRDGKFAAIKSPDGRRLEPGDTCFLEAYQRMHESFEQSPTAAPARTSTKTGTIAHLIEAYRALAQFQ